MHPNAAHENQWETSEVIFGIPLLLSIILGFVWPLAMSHGLLRWLFLVAGIVLFIIAVGWILAARREFARFGQPTDPGRPTSRIVTSGVFSISRNPLYLGIVFLIVGLSLIFNGGWILIMLVPELILCHYILIVPEERYLTSKFGEEYTTYLRSVHRWFGKR